MNKHVIHCLWVASCAALLVCLNANALDEPEDLASAAAKYEQVYTQLLDAEAQHDAYSPQLAEASLAIAHELYETGNYLAAMSQYERALHISRINFGLENAALSPIYQGLARAQFDSGNHSGAFDSINQIARIHYLDPQISQQEKYQTFHAVARTHLGAYVSTSDIPNTRHLIDARFLYQILLDMGMPESLPNPLVTEFNLIYGYALTLSYLIPNDGRQAPSRDGCAYLDSDFHFGPSREINVNFGHSNRVENFRGCAIGLIRDGEAILDRGIEISKMLQSPEIVTEAILLRGDWALMYGGSDEAQKLYQSAWTYAEEHDPSLFEIMSQPQTPSLSMFQMAGLLTNEGYMEITPYSTLPEREEKFDPIRVELAMSIDKYGQPRNVTLADPETEISRRIETFAIQKAREARYRPALAGGETVLYRDHSDTFLYLQDQ